VTKLWVLRNLAAAQDHCLVCGLTGQAALKAEQIIVSLNASAFWRHPICHHVMMYRSGGKTLPVEADLSLWVASYTDP